MHDIADELAGSPEWFPFELEPLGERVSFIRLQRHDYERASFLDARILTAPMTRRSLSWPQIDAAVAAARLQEHCAFIFHIGHVGSTLLSRLVGAHAAAFALREPVVLRALSQLAHPPEAQLSPYLKLLSRTFELKQLAVIKATSFVSELALGLVSRAPAHQAIMMFVPPESYLATILGGPNSRQEARLMAPGRLLRLHQRVGEPAWQLAQLSEGEVVALSWACEMSALVRAAQAAGGRTLWVNFDRFLSSPTPILTAVLRHLGLEASAGTTEAILSGPDMQRYSKAPEHAYDAQLRRDVLNQARAMHGTEIGRGLAWLDRAARQFSQVGQAVAFAR